MDYELLLLNLSRNAKAQASYFRECIGQHLIAAYIAEHGFCAKVYSGDILDAEQVILSEIKVHHVKYIGFYVGADNVVMIGNLIRHLKKSQDVTIWVGGPEAAALGESFLKSTGCDFIIVGEGEYPTLNLLYCLEDGIGKLEDINNLRFLKNNQNLYITPLDAPIMDLDQLPYPKSEDSLHKNFRKESTIGILTGRGCPYHCAFCYEGANSKVVRLRSIENVMDEIDQVMINNPKLKVVNIFDDTFTLYKERVFSFCREMKQRNLFWTCEAHVARLHKNPDMLPYMIDSGLLAMQIGIESGSAHVLDAYQKQTTPEMITEVVQQCKRAGLQHLEGNYIIGGAFETNKTLTESLSHAKELIHIGRGMIELHTVFFAPYYGTPITKNPEMFGMVPMCNYAENIITTMHEPVLQTQELSINDLIQWKNKFDQELQICYFEQGKYCYKSDIVQKLSIGKEIKRLNSRWIEAWNKVPHLREFMQHTVVSEQVYADEKYPIRLGILQKSSKDKIIVDEIVLDGLFATVWLWSNGRYTVQQISRMHGIPPKILASIYTELNYKCLVYFSVF